MLLECLDASSHGTNRSQDFGREDSRALRVDLWSAEDGHEQVEELGRGPVAVTDLMRCTELQNFAAGFGAPANTTTSTDVVLGEILEDLTYRKASTYVRWGIAREGCSSRAALACMLAFHEATSVIGEEEDDERREELTDAGPVPESDDAMSLGCCPEKDW